MTKIILNLRDGLLEVEGEESFVKEVYEDFKKLANDFKSPAHKEHEPRILKTVEKEGKESPKNGSSSNRKKKGVKKSVPTFVKDLDLSVKNNSQDLKEFFKLKSPSNNMEKNVVFIYYLKTIGKVEDITLDHIYTCYKYVNEKVPGALAQSLLDTASRKGWIDTSNMNSIQLPVAGENFVEHDMSAAE